MTKAAAQQMIADLIDRTPESTSKYIDETLAEISAVLAQPEIPVVVGNRVDLADIVATRIYTDKVQAMDVPGPDATEDDLTAWADAMRNIAERAQDAGVIMNQAGQVRRAQQKAAQS